MRSVGWVKIQYKYSVRSITCTMCIMCIIYYYSVCVYKVIRAKHVHRHFIYTYIQILTILGFKIPYLKTYIFSNTRGVSCGDGNLCFSNENHLFPREMLIGWFFYENVDVSKSKYERVVFELFNSMYYLQITGWKDNIRGAMIIWKL